MDTTVYAKLEKDGEFKTRCWNTTLWWKNILFVSPSCFLFLGLFGIVYLLNIDKLVSWYVLPFLAAFTIGTVWLKAVKRHVKKTAQEPKTAFNICIAKTIAQKGGYIYCIFVNTDKRHNLKYISDIAKSLSLDDLLADNNSCKKKLVEMHDPVLDAYFYRLRFLKNDITKKNPDWDREGYFPVLYIDSTQVQVVKRRDLI